MEKSPRKNFINYVRDHKSNRPIISPFLPHPSVVKETLRYLNLPIVEDDIQNEILLSKSLDYEPMFMTDLSGLIFNWEKIESKSDEETIHCVIPTKKGDWVKQLPRKETHWSEVSGCPVQTEADHEKFILVCEQVGDHEKEIREYYKSWRNRVGDEGVIVIGHPHPSWLGYQISPQSIYIHWNDFQNIFKESMEAVYNASLFVMSIAIEEGIDFMSDSSYGLEMTSPKLFEEMDLPYIQNFAEWTHKRNGLFWYHNCGQTRKLIFDGYFNKLGADVIETIAPPPEGDNDLHESRRRIDSQICTKGNLNLLLLRDGIPEKIQEESRKIVRAVDGYKHIYSTADAVLSGTPPENLIVFVSTIREMTK